MFCIGLKYSLPQPKIEIITKKRQFWWILTTKWCLQLTYLPPAKILRTLGNLLFCKKSLIVACHWCCGTQRCSLPCTTFIFEIFWNNRIAWIGWTDRATFVRTILATILHTDYVSIHIQYMNHSTTITGKYSVSIPTKMMFNSCQGLYLLLFTFAWLN